MFYELLQCNVRTSLGTLGSYAKNNSHLKSFYSSNSSKVNILSILNAVLFV